MSRTGDQKLFGAAVLKASFRLRDALDSPAFRAIYPGVLRDLGVSDADVDRFADAHRAEVEAAARSKP